MNPSPLGMDEIVALVNAMRKQEEASYCYRRYLPEETASSTATSDSLLNVTWREKICQWSYNVVDQ